MNEHLYKNKYRTTPARLNGWDYGVSGSYFVTICTKDKAPYFGDITATEASTPTLKRTEIAEVAEDNWQKIPLFCPSLN